MASTPAVIEMDGLPPIADVVPTRAKSIDAAIDFLGGVAGKKCFFESRSHLISF